MGIGRRIRDTQSAGQSRNASRQLAGDLNIRVIELSNDDVWMRDGGPTFVTDGKGGLAAVDWEFNAWGATTAASTPPGIWTTRWHKR